MNIISETIDGSIKDIIQLKTVDNSLEYSQMFDALEDCPDDFKSKLIGALNSLGETMGVSPCDTFNKVLCASDDENAKKKLYNWWKAVFEVVGKSAGNVPKDRLGEYEEKVDALVAEICKAGDKASDDNEVVLEDGTKPVNEMWDSLKYGSRQLTPKEKKTKPKYKKGDILYSTYGDRCRVVSRPKWDKFHGWEYEVWVMDGGNTITCYDEDKLSPKKPAYESYEPADLEDEDKLKEGMQFAISKLGEVANKAQELVNFLNPYCNVDDFNEDNNMKKLNERGDTDWVPMDKIVGMEVGESDDGSQFWKDMDKADDPEKKGEPLDEYEFIDLMKDEDVGDVFEVYDGTPMADGSVCLNVIVNKDDTDNEEVKAEFGDWGKQYGWKYESFSFSSDLAGDEGTETINVYFRPIEKKVDESDLENELNAGDDGWREIGQPVPVKEATVTVDVNDVWDVLDILNDDVANKNLTDLINSHVRSEEEIMDAIENILAESGHSDGVPRDALNALFSADNIADVIEELGLDVEAFMTKREFVDPQKPVTLEGSDDEQKPDEVKDGDKKYKQDGETKTLVTGEKEMSDKDAATIMGGASATDMDAADIGVSSHEVADPYKKPICEMTIEQEVDDPWKLVNLLWGQGKENFQELLDSNLFGDDTIMSTLEQFEIRELGNLNDFLAFEFENFLEALGCDREAWVQHLEITRGGSEEVDEASKKKAAPKDPMIAKIEETIPVDAKDGLIEIRPDRFDSYLAVYAPGSESEMVAATKALSKAFPDYYVGYDNNSIAIWPKKRV